MAKSRKIRFLIGKIAFQSESRRGGIGRRAGLYILRRTIEAVNRCRAVPGLRFDFALCCAVNGRSGQRRQLLDPVRLPWTPKQSDSNAFSKRFRFLNAE
jgi:hypothetical protein